MEFFRLHLLSVLLFLALSVDGNVSTTPVTVKSEKQLTGALLSNLTSLTTSATTEPIMTTEFKRGQYNKQRLFIYLVVVVVVVEL